MTRACIGLGSNLGDREAALLNAVEALGRVPGVEIEAVSGLYETAPVGVLDQPPFLNAALTLRTDRLPAELLAELHRIEREAGRDRASEVRRGPRPLDLDLLLHGDVIVDEPGLTVPHPALAERRFVLVPLCEIAPDAVDPRTGRTVARLLGSCPDTGRVAPWP